jgi:hypothetical protein
VAVIVLLRIVGGVLVLVVLEFHLVMPVVMRLFFVFVSVAVGMHVLVRMTVLLVLVWVKVVVTVHMSMLMFVFVVLPMTGGSAFVTHDSLLRG